MKTSVESNKLRKRTNEFSFLLKPSRIAGIGIFAVHGIAKGTYLAFFRESEPSPLRRVTSKNRFFVERFGVPGGKNAYYCPPDFRWMSIGWYVNHSTKPNAFHINYRYFALRDIKAGTEITIDYRKSVASA
jgi:SET domain-containing protein